MSDYARVAVGVVILREAPSGAVEMLLLQRAVGEHAGQWVSPGGKVDRYEKACDAACREVLEETGMSIEPENLRLLCHIDHIDREIGMHFSGPEFATIVPARIWVDAANKEPEKHSDMRWFNINHLPENLAFPIRQALPSIPYVLVTYRKIPVNS